MQDLGRRGSQRFGVSVSGALDLQAAVIANRLVGNPINSALLESTFGGVSIKFDRETKVAVTGADIAVDIDGFAVEPWETLIVPAEGVLTVAMPVHGLYSYIAIAAGIDVLPVLDSRSTHVASGLGGLDGRALAAGDTLPIGDDAEGASRPRAGTSAPADLVPACDDRSRSVRVTTGPQYEAFDEEATSTFFESAFTISNLTDRQGARLDGAEVIAIDGKHDIVSDPAYMGAVQVPADGKPIVLLADRQPTGGYAKIASVISADLPAVVQRTPGSEVQFELVDIDEAQKITRNFRRSILEDELQKPTSHHATDIAVNGELYNVQLVHSTKSVVEIGDAGIVYAAFDDGSENVVVYELIEHTTG